MFTPRSGGLPIRNLGGSGGPGTGRSTGSNDPLRPSVPIAIGDLPVPSDHYP
jgi:hypothetical protein